jgi:hypothetical protein
MLVVLVTLPIVETKERNWFSLLPLRCSLSCKTSSTNTKLARLSSQSILGAFLSLSQNIDSGKHFNDDDDFRLNPFILRQQIANRKTDSIEVTLFSHRRFRKIWMETILSLSLTLSLSYQNIRYPKQEHLLLSESGEKLLKWVFFLHITELYEKSETKTTLDDRVINVCETSDIRIKLKGIQTLLFFSVRVTTIQHVMQDTIVLITTMLMIMIKRKRKGSIIETAILMVFDNNKVFFFR